MTQCWHTLTCMANTTSIIITINNNSKSSSATSTKGYHLRVTHSTLTPAAWSLHSLGWGMAGVSTPLYIAGLNASLHDQCCHMRKVVYI